MTSVGKDGTINVLAARRGSVLIEVVARAGVDAERTLEQQLFAHL